MQHPALQQWYGWLFESNGFLWLQACRRVLNVVVQRIMLAFPLEMMVDSR
jgi:hypothetical protein